MTAVQRKRTLDSIDELALSAKSEPTSKKNPGLAGVSELFMVPVRLPAYADENRDQLGQGPLGLEWQVQGLKLIYIRYIQAR